MRAFSVLSASLLFVATALGLSVTSPMLGAFWDASQNTQSVAWDSVSSDPTSFTITLVNMVSFHPISASAAFVLTLLPHFLSPR